MDVVDNFLLQIASITIISVMEPFFTFMILCYLCIFTPVFPQKMCVQSFCTRYSFCFCFGHCRRVAIGHTYGHMFTP